MKNIALILLSWISLVQGGQGTFVSKNVRITIFSSAPLEDISANSDKGVSVYNAATGDLAFSLPIRSLTFEKSLMQTHFNENYMESDKYPQAIFKGKIQEQVDLSKDGTTTVNVNGTLEIHGVKQTRTIKGQMIVSKGIITLTSDFIVLCKDHHIEIPQLVFTKIAESIKVTVKAEFAPVKK